MSSYNPSALELAKMILNQLVRGELRDHAFGDREISWMKDGVERAGGFYGQGEPMVWINQENSEETLYDFKGAEALELMKCGSSVVIERNDETGPDEYQDGRCMPGLTLEGVRKELTGK